MYLRSLELSGFKSFAKRINLDFSSAITAIVGPNGSGKSNVAEAFQFVLGEQSIKSLRGKRGEDLIFNGSRTLGRMNRASVKVTFDNTNRLLNIDFDEAIIERVVHRDNNNEYLINASQVRLKDVVEVLSRAHMGPTGHHIISQGEADRILNANIKERRLMIEDALGLKIHQYKRVESERKLERTRENIAQVESLRRELAPHLKFLKKQVEKAEKAKELKSLLMTLYREYLREEGAYLARERTELERSLADPKEKLAGLEHSLSLAKRSLEKAGGHDDKSECLLEFERALRGVRTEKDELVRTIGRLEGTLSSEERRVEKIKELEKEETHRVVPLSEVKQFAGVLEGYLERARELDLPALRNLLSEMKEAVRGLVRRFETTHETEALHEVQSEISRLQKERSSLTDHLDVLSKKEQALQSQYEQFRAEIEKGKDESREAERSMFRIMAEQNEIRSKVAVLESKRDALRLEEEEYEREEKEAAALVGPEVVRDARASAAEVISEVRSLQHDRRRQLEKTKIKLEEFGGGGSEEMLKEYQDASDRDAFLEREIGDLEQSADALESLITELSEKLDFEFREGVRRINTQFEEFFKLMFGGGQASLAVVKQEKRRHSEMDELVALESGGVPPEEEEKTEEGIEIKVSLPHKKVRGLEVLSGGERALTSIALLFAISQVNPPPFIVLDETDAALDEANSKKYGDMIESLSKYSQLVLITHNRETMSRAGTLYGVTMGQDGVSKLLSIQFEEAVRVAK